MAEMADEEANNKNAENSSQEIRTKSSKEIVALKVSSKHEKKSELLKDIEKLQFVIAELNKKKIYKYRDVGGNMKLPGSQNQQRSDASEAANAMIQSIKDDLYRYLGVQCVRFDESYVIQLFNGHKFDESELYSVEILIDKERPKLGRWVMPMSVDLHDVWQQQPLEKLSDIRKFVKNCKHYVDCYASRKRQCEKFKKSLADTSNCFLDTNLGYTRIELRMFQLKEVSTEKRYNVTLYMRYKADQAIPETTLVEPTYNSILPEETMEKLKIYFKAFRTMTLVKAFDKTTSDKRLFEWNKVIAETMVDEVSNESASNEKNEHNLSDHQNSRVSELENSVNKENDSKNGTIEENEKKKKKKKKKSKKVENAKDKQSEKKSMKSTQKSGERIDTTTLKKRKSKISEKDISNTQSDKNDHINLPNTRRRSRRILLKEVALNGEASKNLSAEAEENLQNVEQKGEKSLAKETEVPVATNDPDPPLIKKKQKSVISVRKRTVDHVEDGDNEINTGTKRRLIVRDESSVATAAAATDVQEQKIIEEVTNNQMSNESRSNENKKLNESPPKESSNQNDEEVVYEKSNNALKEIQDPNENVKQKKVAEEIENPIQMTKQIRGTENRKTVTYKKPAKHPLTNFTKMFSSTPMTKRFTGVFDSTEYSEVSEILNDRENILPANLNGHSIIKGGIAEVERKESSTTENEEKTKSSDDELVDENNLKEKKQLLKDIAEAHEETNRRNLRAKRNVAKRGGRTLKKK